MKKRSRKHLAVATSTPQSEKQITPSVSGYAGKPLDGSQYVDVVEEQEYADRRPSPEEQKPRFAYLGKQDTPGNSNKR